VYGNASSIHHFGQNAKQRLESARRQLAALIHCTPTELVFTGGGTEADNLAVLGAVRTAEGPAKHVITSAIEHPAVLMACAQLEREGVAVTRLRVGASGVVNPDDVRSALRPETVLVSIMHANNELGTVQPIAEIARITREAGVLLHVDGVQALGKIAVDVDALGVDLYAMSAHKLYAPKGVGALYVRKGTRLAPIGFGGHHERDRRPGTENVPGIVGFGKAADLAFANLAAEPRRIAALRDRLQTAILNSISSVRVNGDATRRVPNTTNLSFAAAGGEAMLIALDLAGVACSTGAACSSGAVEPSHVLLAIGLSPDEARSSLRFSLGRQTTAEEIDHAIAAIPRVVERLRALSPRSASLVTAR
jgi:cysteine desulfurase